MTSTTSTWDAKKKRLDALKRPEQPFTICEDPEVRERRNRAKAAHQRATEVLADLPPEEEHRDLYEARVKETKTELAAAQKAFDAASVTLRFIALERQEYEDLVKKHPASEVEEAAGEDFALETFAPALISASSLDGMPVDYALHCLNTWSPADARGLWNAAWTIQHHQRTDLGKG
ncbi:hypothetical protein ACFQ0X_43600 [Streptomyces rectiviolaceus]|uniref:Uncharacterized protein n=1 Tax=Streptomyces rectiviolaceus TaxID=332591 RepID=A0ABP6NRN9_9ACTN